MTPVALLEFDNVICDTLEYMHSVDSPFSFKNITEYEQRTMHYHAYAKVMISILRQKNYSIHIYCRRKKFDCDGKIVNKWLLDNKFYYDQIHMLYGNEDILNIISLSTYLISTSIDDAIRLKTYSVLSSATIVACELNSNRHIPNYCDRVYYKF